MTMAKYLLLFVASIALSSAQSEEPLTDVLKTMSLPPELQGKVDVEAMQNKTLNEFKTRCEKNGGPEAFTRAQNGSLELQQCIKGLVDFATLQQEVEEAKPKGNVDLVFKKYCQKKPQFEDCVQNFTDSSALCFSEQEKGHLKTVHNVSIQLAEFICFKEGDRIALFISEGGQECFRDNQEQLRDCANTTMGLGGELDLNSMPNATLTFDENQCGKLDKLEKCVVAVLETCPKPTSANIVESLFRFIKGATPCKDFFEAKKGGAATFFIASATLATALAVTALV